MPRDAVEQLRDALQADNPEAVADQFDPFDRAVTQQERKESALRDIARRIISTTTPEMEQYQTAQSLLKAMATADQARIQAKTDLMYYFQGGHAADSVIEQLDQLATAHSNVSTAESNLRNSIPDSVETPPAYVVNGPEDIILSKGTEFELSYTVENVGLSPVESLPVSFSGYEAELSTDRISALKEGEEITITVSGSASTTADSYFVVSAGIQSVQTSLLVLDKAGFIEKAKTQLSDFQQHLEETEQQINSNLRPIYQKTQNTQKFLDKIQTNLGKHGAKSTKKDKNNKKNKSKGNKTPSVKSYNSRLQAAQKKSKALESLTDTLNALPKTKRTSLKSELDNYVDLLDKAIEADL